VSFVPGARSPLDAKPTASADARSGLGEDA